VSESVLDLPISRISPHPDNVRGSIAPDEAEEMALSILLRMNQGLSGIIQPLVVVVYNGGYRTVDGHVRLVGAKKLLETGRWPQGVPRTLPAIVRDLTLEQQRAIMLASNIVRYSLNPVDEGLAYLRMAREEGLDKSKIADRCGVPRSRVELRLCIVGLAPPVVEMFRRGELPLGAAKHLAKVTDQKVQVDLANTLVEMDAIRLDTIAEACGQVARAGRESGAGGGSGNGQGHKAETGGNAPGALSPSDGAAASKSVPVLRGAGSVQSPARQAACEGSMLGLAEVQAAVALTCQACPSRALPGRLSWTRAEQIWMGLCAKCVVADRIAAACGDCPLALFLDVLLGEEGDGGGS
jgi:ParB/RepB/Spo0J family partition protein